MSYTEHASLALWDLDIVIMEMLPVTSAGPYLRTIRQASSQVQAKNRELVSSTRVYYTHNLEYILEFR